MLRRVFLFLLFFSFISIAYPQKLIDEGDMQKIILGYMNAYRAKYHRPPLKLVPIISIQAKKHSLEMADHKMPFGHQGFNERIGTLYKQIAFCRGGAENIAYSKQDAAIVAKLWTESRGHRANILGNYNLTGIGVVRTKEGWIYYTQMFIRSDDPKFRS